MIAKTNEVFENETQPMFFMSACLEKQIAELGKSSFVLQRYIIAKGLGCNVIRAVMTISQRLKDSKLAYYRIGSSYRYDGSDLSDKGLNVKKIESFIEKNKNLKHIKRFLSE